MRVQLNLKQKKLKEKNKTRVNVKVSSPFRVFRNESIEFGDTLSIYTKMAKANWSFALDWMERENKKTTEINPNELK